MIASSTARRRTAAIFGWNSSQPAPTGHGISSSGPNAGRPALDGVRRAERGRQERREQTWPFDDEGVCLVALEGCPGGIEHRSPVAPDEPLHRVGERGVAEQARQIHDVPFPERSQSPVPPPVEGHEPQGRPMIRPAGAGISVSIGQFAAGSDLGETGSGGYD